MRPNRHSGLVLVLFLFFAVYGSTSAETDQSLPSFGFANDLPSRVRVGTEIHFVLSSDGPATLVILDVYGRTVAKFVDGTRAAGRHVATWTGLDSSGAEFPDGVYFVRLAAGGYTEIRKVLVIR